MLTPLATVTDVRLRPCAGQTHRLEPEQQAASHIAAGRLDEALAAVEAIVSPGALSTFEKRDLRDALVLVKAGDLEQAAVVLEGKSTPMNELADALRLHMFRDAEKFDRELAALMGFDFFPDDDDLQAHIKALVADVGPPAVAARLRRIAARLDTELPLSSHGPLARSMAELVLGHDGDTPVCISAAREALDRDRNDVTLWTNLWYSLPDDMPPRERDKLGRDALRQFADDAIALDELDTAFHLDKGLSKAVEQRMAELAHQASAGAGRASSSSSTSWAGTIFSLAVVGAALWWMFGR
jgi:hypothetical protein